MSTTITAPRPSTPRSIEELLAGIEARRDELDAAADECEHLGRPSAALGAMMRDLRVGTVKAPHEVGGDLLGFVDQFRYFEALSNANPTAGWTGFNHAGAGGVAGACLDDDGVGAVFGDGAAPIMAAVAAPTGTYAVVDGGVRATGRWRYASGIGNAEFVLLTTLERSSGARPLLLTVPIADVRVEGEWEVMALKGTGSIDAVLDDVFVPQHMIIDRTVPPRRGGGMFTTGYPAYVAPENLGFTIGVCQRFVDEAAGYACAKSRGVDGRLADRGAFQYELGRGQLQVDAARAFGLQRFAEADTALAAAGRLTSTQQQALHAMLAYSTELAVDAVTRLFHFAGAGALFTSSVLQRCFRDAHGSAQHQVASNAIYDRVGRALLDAQGIVKKSSG